MFRSKAFVVFLALFFTLFSVSAYALEKEPTTEELMKEIQALKERVLELESKLGTQEKTLHTHDEKLATHEEHIHHSAGVKELFSYDGLVIGAGATFVAQGTPNANNAGDNEASRFDGSFKADIDIEKEFGDFGLGYILLEAGAGDTVESELAVFSNVNYAAYDSSSNVDVVEAWYEQYLFEKQLAIKGGKIDTTTYLDDNNFAHDETTQFLGRMFRNSPAIEFPSDNGPGALVTVSPKDTVDFVQLEGIWADADADWENLSDRPFIAGEINFMPAKAFDYDEAKWEGNYRFYYWYNGTPHTKWKDGEKNKESNYGFGISLDQKLGEVFGIFSRFGWQDPKVSIIEYHWSFGAEMTGEYWNRKDDVLALAVGQAIPGKDYGDAGNPHRNETHLETYYSFKVNDYLTLSPDFQVIWDPNGFGNEEEGDNDPIFVYGGRAQVGF